MALTVIKIAINKLDATHADFNTTLQGLCIQATISGATITYESGFVNYKVHSENISMATAIAVVGLGATVSNFPFFIEMVQTDSVPSGVPNRSYEDDNGNTVILDWVNWKLSNFDIHTATDGTKYLAGEANTGDIVTLNDFASVFDDCVDAATFTAAMG